MIGKQQIIAAWVFGSVLLVILCTCLFAGQILWPAGMEAYQHQLLGILSALSVAFLATLLTGNLDINIESGCFSSLTLRAGGGIGLFILTLYWWGHFMPIPISSKPAMALEWAYPERSARDQRLESWRRSSGGGRTPVPISADTPMSDTTGKLSQSGRDTLSGSEPELDPEDIPNQPPVIPPDETTPEKQATTPKEPPSPVPSGEGQSQGSNASLKSPGSMDLPGAGLTFPKSDYLDFEFLVTGPCRLRVVLRGESGDSYLIVKDVAVGAGDKEMTLRRVSDVGEIVLRNNVGSHTIDFFTSSSAFPSVECSGKLNRIDSTRELAPASANRSSVQFTVQP